MPSVVVLPPLRCAALAALALLALAPEARAQLSWAEVARPGIQRAERLRREGEWLRLLDEFPEMLRARLAPELGDRVRHDDLRPAALARFEAALALTPDDPRLLAAAAHLRERLNDLDGAARDAARSLALDPLGPSAEGAHFTAAVVATWRGEHVVSRDHYLALLALPIEERTRATVLGNLGDELQALGDMRGAVASYEACVALTPGYALGWLGLAIARDRAQLDPAPDAARALRAAMAATRDPRPDDLLDALSADHVFYVPSYDRFYYEGMAHEAIARALAPGNDLGLAPDAARVDAHRRAAAEAWRRYVDGSPADDPWRARVEAHRRALARAPR